MTGLAPATTFEVCRAGRFYHVHIIPWFGDMIPPGRGDDKGEPRQAKGAVGRGSAERLTTWRRGVRPGRGAKLKNHLLGRAQNVTALKAGDVAIAMVAFGEQIAPATRAALEIDHDQVPPGRLGGRPNNPIPARASFSRRRASESTSMA